MSNPKKRRLLELVEEDERERAGSAQTDDPARNNSDIGINKSPEPVRGHQVPAEPVSPATTVSVDSEAEIQSATRKITAPAATEIPLARTTQAPTRRGDENQAPKSTYMKLSITVDPVDHEWLEDLSRARRKAGRPWKTVELLREAIQLLRKSVDREDRPYRK